MQPIGRRASLLAAALAVAAAGCGRDGPPNAPRARHDETGFSIVPPREWTRQELDGAGIMGFTGPKVDGFAVHFSVAVQSAGGDDLEQFARNVNRAQARGLDDYRLVERGFATIGGRRWRRLSARFRLGDLPVRDLQYFTIAGDRAFVLRFAVPARVFRRYRPLLEWCANTARVDAAP